MGNSLFGYSSHPLPPSVLGEADAKPLTSASMRSLASTASSREKMTALSQAIAAEQAARKALEAELGAVGA